LAPETLTGLPLFSNESYNGRAVAQGETAEFYHQHATEMWAQAERAETGYLKGVYTSIAENWEQIAAQMEAGTLLEQRIR
jgi:hypothetical protein